MNTHQSNHGKLAQGVSQGVLAEIRQFCLEQERSFLDVLEERLELPPEQFVSTLSSWFCYPRAMWDSLSESRPDFGTIPYSECAKRECVAIRTESRDIEVIIANPYDSDTLSWLEANIKVEFELQIAHRHELTAYLEKYEDHVRATDDVNDNIAEISTDAGTPSDFEDLSLRAITANDNPIVKLVNSTLYDALKTRASDIHFEATDRGLNIKHRIDGVLSVVRTIDGIELAEQTLSRIKVLAELDIAERRIPQDGRFQAMYKGREIDFRVSIMPSIHGEDSVVRILDKRYLIDQAQGLTLGHLGFEPLLAKQLRRLAAEPYGMLLVTGPTGSGKTTTLYALISEVNQGIDKIITIEDPVEYQLPGVLQIPVNEKKGLTFARGLRSILRHDPDRIMVGEIRDPETAEIAVQSALTGHLLYTTVHANNVIDVIGRLLHMKLDPYSFVSALNAVLAQRLVRLNCPNCIETIIPSKALLEESGITEAEAEKFNFTRSQGCEQCRGTGYRGRKAIGELLIFNDVLRELVVSRASTKTLKEKAAEHGTRFLREAGLDLVRQGETSLEEINRVTFVA